MHAPPLQTPPSVRGTHSPPGCASLHRSHKSLPASVSGLYTSDVALSHTILWMRSVCWCRRKPYFEKHACQVDGQFSLFAVLEVEEFGNGG